MFSYPRLAGFLLLCGALPAAAAQEVPAEWKKHELDFTYMGFTTRYSCEGLRDKMRVLLKASGARPGFRVTSGTCAAAPGGVTEFPRVRLVFETAQIPATGSRDAGEPVLAQWRAVTLARNQPRPLEPGDCELVEQFRDRVLPAFTTRRIDGDINCIPHQLSVSSFLLKFEALEGLPDPDAAKPSR
jgi:hypothetical protein